jgi:DNA-binding MarR family transcriptional regulator
VTGDLDPARLSAVISPLRRVLLASARAVEHLPDIPDAQIEVIRLLPRGVVSSPGELAERLGISRSTVSNLLSAMESGGLVARRTAVDDRRRVEVLASARALGLFERFDEASAALVGEAAASLSAAERAALAAAIPALERLRDALAARRGAEGSIAQTRASHTPHTRKEAE